MADKNKKSAMWSFFEKINDSKISCKICRKDYKFCNNTSNMKDHLMRKHPEVLSQPSTSTEGENSLTTSTERTWEKSNNNSDNKYAKNSSRKKFLDSIFVKMIATDLQPLRLCEHKGLKEFVNALDSKYELPSRTYISTNLLPKLYNTLKVDLMDILKEVNSIAITTDMWTSPSNQGICAITCHFILKNNLHAALLEAVLVEGRHDAESLALAIETVLTHWNCREKVVALVTDNAATMIRVSEILQLRHIPCFAHSLNLILKDVLNKTELSTLLEKCKAIVRHFRQSTLASDKLKYYQRELNKPELKLIQHVDTRWNSSLYMFQRIKQIREELTLAMSQLPNSPPNLTIDEYDLLGEIEKIFEPIETCTSAISGEEYSTLSLIIPLIKGLSLAIANIEKQNLSETAKAIVQHIKVSVNMRFKQYESRTPCLASTLLNPHLKKMGFKTDCDADRAINCVQREYSNYLARIPQVVTELQTTETEVSVSSEGSASKKTKLSNLLSFLITPQNINSTSNAIVDIRQYLEKPIIPRADYPIEYWNYSENRLKHIALKYLCIPGSSVPSERIFSKAGLIVTERRNRLSAKHINQLLFINQNQKLFKK